LPSVQLQARDIKTKSLYQFTAEFPILGGIIFAFSKEMISPEHLFGSVPFPRYYQNSTVGSRYAFYIGGAVAEKFVTERSAMQMTAV
jgi:hypothetical protein